MDKWRRIISYGIFGALTTGINIACFFILIALGINYIFATSIAWIVSVIFAFVANKIYVFKSKDKNIRLVFKEINLFILLRSITYFFDVLIMIIMVGQLGANASLAKVISNIIIVIFNYVLSKKVIFKSAQSNG